MGSVETIRQTLSENWENIKQSVRSQCTLTDISYNTWISPLSFLSFSDGRVAILIPSDNQIQKNYLENNFSDFFKVIVSEKLGVTVEVDFVLQTEVPDNTGAVTDTDEASPHSGARLQNNPTLNDKYRFDTFVVGKNNTFAHSASLAVAESPGKLYNPLYLYGGPGLGKTHLMHSIGHYIMENNPQMKVLYVTSEQFTNEVIEAIRTGKQDSKVMTKLREKYRTVDVLMVDDVQFIIGKESTQEEFFHTFNELHQTGRQVVISCDKPPRDLEILDERFRSRFEMGLLSDLQPPDYETKMAILKKLGESYPFHIEDEAYAYIANNIKSNIRELEGAFNQIIAHYKINNLPKMTEDDVKEALKNNLHADKEQIITIKTVLDAVCEHYSVRRTELESKKRNAEVVEPRQVVMYLARKYATPNGYTEIGKYLGGRDHSTVMSGVDRMKALLKTDEDLQHHVDIITKKINPST